jgi:hypothetical protein
VLSVSFHLFCLFEFVTSLRLEPASHGVASSLQQTVQVRTDLGTVDQLRHLIHTKA